MKLTKSQALAEILRLMREYGLTLEEIQGQDSELTTWSAAGVVTRLMREYGLTLEEIHRARRE